MVNEVTLNSNVYTDGSSDEGVGKKNMGNGGHKKNLLPMMQDFLVEAQTRIDLTGASLSANSTTSMAIANTGSIPFTMSTGKGFAVGTRIRAARTSAPTTTWMEGVITAFNASTGATTFTADNSLGAGTFTDWTISIAGTQGVAGTPSPYITTAGTSTAYTATFSPAITSHTIGVPLLVKFHVDSGTAPTITINGLTAKSLVDSAGAAVSGIKNGQLAFLAYDGTNYQVLGGSGGGASGVYTYNAVASSGASRTLDFTTYFAHDITLTANCTLSFTLPTVAAGKQNEYLATFRQDATGGRVITWPSNGTTTIWSGTASSSTPPVLNPLPNSITVIRFKQVAGASAVIVTVEGTNVGSSSGNIPVVGVYVAAGPNIPGATAVNYKSSNGTSFTAGGTMAPASNQGVQDIIYNPVYSRFVSMLARSGTVTAAQRFGYSTDNGASWNSASGSVDCTRDANDRIVLFSNGNMCNLGYSSGTNNQVQWSGDGGSNWSGKSVLNADSSIFRYAVTANTAIFFKSGSATFAYSTDGLTTSATSGTHTGITTPDGVAYANGNWFFSTSAGSCGYKTSVSTLAITPFTSNLASATLKGAVHDGTGYVIWTDQSLSSGSTPGGSWTSRTTAFYTTAGMTGNIVNMHSPSAGVIVAFTDTGDEARTIDQGATWAKTAPANNFLSGVQIYSGTKINGNIYFGADSGKIGYTTDGLVISSVLNAGGVAIQKVAGG